jgi:hypothetical protein
MAAYDIIKTQIDALFRDNGIQDITGDKAAIVYKAMIDSLGVGYLDLGSVDDVNFDPGAPDQKVSYILLANGTYINFDGIEVDNEFVRADWDGADWTKRSILNLDALDYILNQKIIETNPIQPSLYYDGESAFSVVRGSNQFSYGLNSFTFIWKTSYPKTQKSTFKTIFGKNSSTQNHFTLISSSNPNTFGYYDSEGSGFVNSNKVSYLELDSGIFTYAIVRDVENNKILLYKDGNLIKDDVLSGVVNLNVTALLNIMLDISGVVTFMYSFNKALTQQEITDITLSQEVPYKYQGANNTDLLSGWNFTSGWNDTDATIDDADSFTTTTIGYIDKPDITLKKGKLYKLRIAGNTTADVFQVRSSLDVATGIIYINDMTGTFDEEVEFIAEDNGISLRNAASGTTNITTFELVQLGETWSITPEGRGINSDEDTSGNGNHANHTNVEISGYLDKDQVYQNNITGDTLIQGKTNLVRKGFFVDYILLENTTGNIATLDCGTTPGGNDIFINQVVPANGILTIPVNKVLSLIDDTPLYLNDDDGGSSWNSSSINFKMKLKK